MGTGSREIYIWKITKYLYEVIHPFPNLITKESYNWWVTRRFGDLDNKYLKQNISKYPKISVANIRKLQENTAALCKMAALPSG